MTNHEMQLAITGLIREAELRGMKSVVDCLLHAKNEILKQERKKIISLIRSAEV